jgi:hypothetical protein
MSTWAGRSPKSWSSATCPGESGESLEMGAGPGGVRNERQWRDIDRDRDWEGRLIEISKSYNDQDFRVFREIQARRNIYWDESLNECL